MVGFVGVVQMVGFVGVVQIVGFVGVKGGAERCRW